MCLATENSFYSFGGTSTKSWNTFWETQLPTSTARDSGLGLGQTGEREASLERECDPGKGTTELE